MDHATAIALLRPKAKPTVAMKRPATAITSFPALSPVARAPPVPASGQLWHGGPKVQKPWLKKVQKAHELCRSAHTPHMMSKTRGTAESLDANIPPPMPSVLSSLSLTAQWNARWQDKHVNSKDWRPERNTIVIAGRPVGVIIVSHQGSSPIEWDSYHNLLFKPLRPVVLLGPTGRSMQAPKLEHKFTVIEWWKVIFCFREPSYVCLLLVFTTSHWAPQPPRGVQSHHTPTELDWYESVLECCRSLSCCFFVYCGR